MTYQWDWVSDDMPGNIKAKAHSDLPRDVQFTDEKSRYFKPCMIAKNSVKNFVPFLLGNVADRTCKILICLNVLAKI